MRPITTAELTSLRKTATAILDQTCTIQVPTEADDDMGGFEASYASTYTNVPCKLSSPSPGESRENEGERFAVAVIWWLRVKQSQPIESGYRVVVASHTYEVMNVEDDHQWATIKRARLRRINFDGE